MALLTSEIYRIKAELGHTVLTLGAGPYIGIAAIFEQVIAPYMSSGAVTTSATAVTAAPLGAAVTLTLASATGFSAGDRVFIDVDDLQESATVRSLSGSSMGVFLKLGHAAGYPVTVDGGEGIVREILRNIRAVKQRLGEIFGEGALKQVDELGWYDTRGKTLFGNLGDQLRYWRRELSQVLSNGQQLNMWERAAGSAQRLSVY